MKSKFFWFCAICLSSIAFGQKTYLDSEENIRLLRFIRRDFAPAMIGNNSAESGTSLDKLKKLHRVQNRIPNDVPFPCNVSAGRSDSVPTSVHKLRPGDIDVTGAIGDSLSAGTGILATSIFHLLIENRGISTIGGGQGTWRDYLTVPNILKEFNPNLLGYCPHDSTTSQEASQFNVAELFAMSRDLPFMAEVLIRRIKSHPKVDVKKHWKLINILVGHNDFCADMCFLQSGAWSTLKNHKADLIKTLRLLKKHLPRTLVSVIPPPNLIIIALLKNKPPICQFTTTMECPCLVGLPFRAKRKEFTKIMTRWQEIDEEVAAYPEFQMEDFAVVAQPFATNLKFPTDGTIEWRYLSSDCFHLSQLANARASLALWKNMLEPVGVKSRDWAEYGILCPTESRPYIATSVNSQRASNNNKMK